jgi:hypothetical protein
MVHDDRGLSVGGDDPAAENATFRRLTRTVDNGRQALLSTLPLACSNCRHDSFPVVGELHGVPTFGADE